MQDLKETMNRIMNGLACSEASEEQFKSETVCRECHKEFSYDRREHFYKLPAFCSENCQKVYRERKEEERRKQFIKEIIPRKYQELETDQKDLLKLLLDKNLFVTGEVGTGKTLFISSLAKKYILAGRKVDWISYPAFIMELQNAYREETVSPFAMAEDKARFEGYLFIDDLGAEKLTDFVRQITYFILNEREQRMLPTVITSNFSLEEIDKSIDSRVSSRIVGMCEVMKFEGVDKRAKK